MRWRALFEFDEFEPVWCLLDFASSKGTVWSRSPVLYDCARDCFDSLPILKGKCGSEREFEVMQTETIDFPCPNKSSANASTTLKFNPTLEQQSLDRVEPQPFVEIHLTQLPWSWL